MSSSSSRLQCLGKSSPGSKKQPGVAVTSARSETHKRSDTLRKETVVNRTKPRSLPSCALSSSIQETPKSVSLNLDLLNTEVCAQMSINITPRGEEPAKSAAVSSEELKLKAQPSAVTAGRTLASPIAERLPEHEVNEEEEQTDKEDIEDEDLKAPVELIIEFLRAIMDKDFQLASKLCQMILIYEPHNLDASEFLPLIRKQLQKGESSSSSSKHKHDDDDDDDEDDNDNDDDSEDTESDEESSDSSSSSSSSCSSSSSSDDDEEEEK
uniref:Glutamate-rich protein 2 n=1 Tax=Anabas testudineus TaxID=64144 RepID=A0A3Q1HD60_ANATE